MTAPCVLFVVTSHGLIEDSPQTGVWFTDFSLPYAALTAAGCDIVVASPKGAAAPIDPRSYPGAESFAGARDAMRRLGATYPLATIDARDYDAIFLPGGLGMMFDTARCAMLKSLLRNFSLAKKPIGSIGFGQAALLGVDLHRGATLLTGKRVSGCAEAAAELSRFVPFSLLEAMRAEGAIVSDRVPCTQLVEVDDLLVTGRTTASAAATARAFAKILGETVTARRTNLGNPWCLSSYATS